MEIFSKLKERYDQEMAYISITNEQGPSEQLLAFINFDSKLEEEIGLEGYNTLSLQARHEILLSKLNPDETAEIALEGLGSSLSKFGDFLEKEPETGLLVLGGIAIATVIAGSLVIAFINRNKVLTYDFYTKQKEYLEYCLALDEKFINLIPTSFEEDKWRKCHESLLKKHPGQDGKYTEYTDIFHGSNSKLVPYGDSGWDVDKLSKEAAELSKFVSRIKTLKNKARPILRSIESWLQREERNSKEYEISYTRNDEGKQESSTKVNTKRLHSTHWYISECTKVWFDNFYLSQRSLEDCHETLDRVVRLFKKKGIS